jgi:hypothetical protein
MRKHTVAAALMAGLFCMPAARAQEMNETERFARAYMEHYSAVDWDTMEGYLAEDVVFADPTAMGPDYGEDGALYEGREAVMEALRSFSASYNPIELGFEWDTVFESNGRVVFMGHVNALYPARTEGQNFRWRAEQVTVVTVRDGVVIRHDDYANYANPEQGLIPAAE